MTMTDPRANYPVPAGPYTPMAVDMQAPGPSWDSWAQPAGGVADVAGQPALPETGVVGGNAGGQMTEQGVLNGAKAPSSFPNIAPMEFATGPSFMRMSGGGSNSPAPVEPSYAKQLGQRLATDPYANLANNASLRELEAKTQRDVVAGVKGAMMQGFQGGTLNSTFTSAAAGQVAAAGAKGLLDAHGKLLAAASAQHTQNLKDSIRYAQEQELAKQATSRAAATSATSAGAQMASAETTAASKENVAEMQGKVQMDKAEMDAILRGDKNAIDAARARIYGSSVESQNASRVIEQPISEEQALTIEKRYGIPRNLTRDRLVSKLGPLFQQYGVDERGYVALQEELGRNQRDDAKNRTQPLGDFIEAIAEHDPEFAERIRKSPELMKTPVTYKQVMEDLRGRRKMSQLEELNPSLIRKNESTANLNDTRAKWIPKQVEIQATNAKTKQLLALIADNAEKWQEQYQGGLLDQGAQKIALNEKELGELVRWHDIQNINDDARQEEVNRHNLQTEKAAWEAIKTGASIAAMRDATTRRGQDMTQASAIRSTAEKTIGQARLAKQAAWNNALSAYVTTNAQGQMSYNTKDAGFQQTQQLMQAAARFPDGLTPDQVDAQILPGITDPRIRSAVQSFAYWDYQEKQAMRTAQQVVGPQL